jgi:hypothetical protein
MTAPIDTDRACTHENFVAEVDVNRICDGDHGRPDVVIGYYADIRVVCADCNEAFRWNGLTAGQSPRHPMCSPDETEMRAPLRPASADPDFGMSISGFAINMQHDPALQPDKHDGPGR